MFRFKDDTINLNVNAMFPEGFNTSHQKATNRLVRELSFCS